MEASVTCGRPAALVGRAGAAARAGARSRRRGVLMQRVQAGDGAAYRELLDDVRPLIRATLRRSISDAFDLEDAHQEALVALHRARHTFQTSQPLEPWLLAIVRHVAARHVRSRSTRLSREVPHAEVPDVVTEPPVLEVETLDRLLERLPASQRDAFEMLKLEGLSVEAAAARAGTSVGALKVRAHRAYKAIRSMLGARS